MPGDTSKHPEKVTLAPVNPSPCTVKCPLGTNVKAYVSLVAAGRFAEALEVVRKTNPFPIGSEMEITMSLENEGSITVKGVVVHVNGLLFDVFNSTPGMGVQFKDITDNQMMTLKRYKERLFAEDIFRGTFPKYC